MLVSLKKNLCVVGDGCAWFIFFCAPKPNVKFTCLHQWNDANCIRWIGHYHIIFVVRWNDFVAIGTISCLSWYYGSIPSVIFTFCNANAFCIVCTRLTQSKNVFFGQCHVIFISIFSTPFDCSRTTQIRRATACDNRKFFSSKNAANSVCDVQIPISIRLWIIARNLFNHRRMQNNETKKCIHTHHLRLFVVCIESWSKIVAKRKKQQRQNCRYGTVNCMCA